MSVAGHYGQITDVDECFSFANFGNVVGKEEVIKCCLVVRLQLFFALS